MDLVWYPLPNWHRPHQRLLSSRGGGLIHPLHSIHPYIIFRTAPREKLPSLHFKLCIWRSKPCVPSFVPVNLNSLKLRNIWIQHNSTTQITWVHMFMAHHGSTFNKPFLVARGICREPDFAAAGGACVSLDEIKEVHSQFQETAWVTGPMEVMLPWKSTAGDLNLGVHYCWCRVDWDENIILYSCGQEPRKHKETIQRLPDYECQQQTCSRFGCHPENSDEHFPSRRKR